MTFRGDRGSGKKGKIGRESPYIPALSYRFLTPLYDPLLRWGMRELTFKRRLLKEAKIAPRSRVLDMGCGTGTLTVLVKEAYPQAEVAGLDGDVQVLEIARKKATRIGTQIQFDEGMAYQLPYPNASYDRVLSSLMIHHLVTDEKVRAFAEVFRVLRSGGVLLVIDYGKPNNLLAEAISLVMRRLEQTEDSIMGRLPQMMRSAGFQDVEILDSLNTLFGTIMLYRGRKVNQ